MSSDQSETKAKKKYRESIKREAHLLWVANGKQEGKDDDYWTLAIEKVNNQFNKEFLEKYQIYRDHIKHEDNLGNQRLSFFLASQSFLFFPYFNVFAKYKDNGFNGYDFFLLALVCCLGVGTSYLTKYSVQGFVDASSAIALIWKRQCSLYNERAAQNQIFSNLQYYKYNSTNRELTPIGANNVPIKFCLLLLSQDCLAGILFLRKSLAQTQNIIEHKDFAFLEINDQIVPNIRYENPSLELNKKIEKFSNKIPMWFQRIWIALFVISSVLFLINYVLFLGKSVDESTKTRVEQMLNNDHRNSVEAISKTIDLLGSALIDKQEKLDNKIQENENLKNNLDTTKKSYIKIIVEKLCENKIDSQTVEELSKKSEQELQTYLVDNCNLGENSK